LNPQLTNVSSKRAHRVLKKLGFIDARCKGSHQSMVRERADGGFDVLTLVLGKKEIKPYTMRGILTQGSVSIEDFIREL